MVGLTQSQLVKSLTINHCLNNLTSPKANIAIILIVQQLFLNPIPAAIFPLFESWFSLRILNLRMLRGIGLKSEYEHANMIIGSQFS